MEWQEEKQRGGKGEGSWTHGRADCLENDMGIDRCLSRTALGSAGRTQGAGHIQSFIHRHRWVAGNKEIDLEEEIK